jgi:hypothetical protein
VSKGTLQLVVALVVVAAWAIAVLVAINDGNTLLRVTTPMMTGVMGWLFTEKATTA